MRTSIWLTIACLSLFAMFFGASESVSVVNTMAAGGGIATIISLFSFAYFTAK